MFEGVRGVGEGGGRRFPTAFLGRIDVGDCYTRGARSRRWCGWWGRRGLCGELYSRDREYRISLSIDYRAARAVE